MSVHRSIPQMRRPPVDTILAVASATEDGVGYLTLRGDARPDALDPLLASIDGLFATGVRAIVLDCVNVTSWSRRGLEVAVLTATRAHEQRIAFAACGLPEEQLAFLHRQWPGVRAEQFAHPGRRAAQRALLSHSN